MVKAISIIKVIKSCGSTCTHSPGLLYIYLPYNPFCAFARLRRLPRGHSRSLYFGEVTGKNGEETAQTRSEQVAQKLYKMEKVLPIIGIRGGSAV